MTELTDDNDPRGAFRKRIARIGYLTIGIPGLFVVWAVIVGLSGAGFNITGVEWDFARIGALGDSFGVIGAIMATAAAAFTFLTLRDERSENARLRERETARDRADSKREAETTFFQLLELRNQILERIRVPGRAVGSTPIEGMAAVTMMANNLANMVVPLNDASQDKYDDYWRVAEGEVGHYLRFTYHIVRHVVDNFDNDRDMYKYVRILRAQLSNAEAQLIALNSMFGEGNPRMKILIETFALLHNLPKRTVERLELKTKFSSSAFDTSGWQGASNKKNN